MRTRVLTAAGAVLLMGVAALAQFGGPRGPFHEYPNIPYDGQFTFVRLKYTHGAGRQLVWRLAVVGPRLPAVRAEPHAHHAGGQLHRTRTSTTSTRVTLDDPALFRYPIAYIIEVDWWAMTDREAAALRTYLQKGGFVIVDDFKPRRDGSAAASAAGLAAK